MFFEEVPNLKTVVNLKFSSIYSIYLKLWIWATKNFNNFNDVFPLRCANTSVVQKFPVTSFELIYFNP